MRSLALVAVIAALLPSVAAAQSRYLWSHTVDGAAHGSDRAGGLALGVHGEVYVAGFSQNATDNDALVRAYDANGTLLWERRIDLGGNDGAFAVFVDGAANALHVSGSTLPIGSALTTAVAWQLDPATGSVLAQHTFAGPQNQGVYGSFRPDGAGGWLLAGYLGSPSAHDAALVRFDASFTPTWTWNGSSDGYVSSLAQDPNGGYALMSVVSDARFVHRLDANGAQLWAHTLGVGNSSGPLVDSNSNLVYVIDESANRRLERVDAAGNLLWSRARPRSSARARTCTASRSTRRTTSSSRAPPRASRASTLPATCAGPSACPRRSGSTAASTPGSCSRRTATRCCACAATRPTRSATTT